MKIWIAILSILGGISGIVSGFLVTAGGALFDKKDMANDGSAIFWLSILAIFVGFLTWVPKKAFRKICGLLLIFFSFYGFVLNGLFFTFAFIFLLIAGCLALFMKDKKQNKEIAA
jgi:CHASE2 domain-containing sensor protein